MAKKLRKNQTAAEKRFWEICRRVRDSTGIKFYRQIVLAGYIVDVWCPSLKLVLEVDGGIHTTEAQAGWDRRRDRALRRELGAYTVRFTNDDVLSRPAATEKKLRQALKTRAAYLAMRR